MVAVLEDKRDEIAALCRKYGVQHLYVFGSALGEDSRPGESDVDMLVELGPMDGRTKAHAYFDMLDEPAAHARDDARTPGRASQGRAGKARTRQRGHHAGRLLAHLAADASG